MAGAGTGGSAGAGVVPQAAVVSAIRSQFEASLAMLDGCLRACPDDRWDARPPLAVATYPFWQVAYHALCYVDCYLSRGSDAFEPRTQGQDGHPPIHPAGMAELREEFPSRRFERDELRWYVGVCLEKLRAELARETPGALSEPSGFSWLPMSRLELHLYNLRHCQHHTGQLTAYLRRFGVETKWVKAGFPGEAGR